MPLVGDANWKFNEQQVFYWAQVLKTQIDDWDRVHNSDGEYPVDATRDVNVEIVVNGNSTQEETWCGGGVQHGCFSTNKPATGFLDSPPTRAPSFSSTARATLTASSSSATSPPRLTRSSGTKVGHFITWQYGGWPGGTNTNISRSLNEGMSMVLAALFGRKHWLGALTYTSRRKSPPAGITAARRGGTTRQARR